MRHPAHIVCKILNGYSQDCMQQIVSHISVFRRHVFDAAATASCVQSALGATRIASEASRAAKSVHSRQVLLLLRKSKIKRDTQYSRRNTEYLIFSKLKKRAYTVCFQAYIVSTRQERIHSIYKVENVGKGSICGPPGGGGGGGQGQVLQHRQRCLAGQLQPLQLRKLQLLHHPVYIVYVIPST